MLHYAVEHAFEDLLRCWRVHQVTISRKASTVTRRADTRIQLDNARRRMHELRIAVYPEPAERESVVDRVWCESLEAVVHLRWADRHASRPGSFRCVCGAQIEIDWNRLGVDQPWTGAG